jgi:hypothetical protein
MAKNELFLRFASCSEMEKFIFFLILSFYSRVVGFKLK